MRISDPGSGSSTLGWILIRIRIHRFDDQKLKKSAAEIFYFFIQKLQFTYP